ncbi:HIT domain-containing protein [Candidatus Pacearchaeota archaeon]|nr:HIT domain-containing protein [Candidatus Pacearchaeota archaeon]
MTLNEEQIKVIKEQLFQQIANFPEEKREETQEYIAGLNAQQLEEFLIKNNLLGPENFESPSSVEGEPAQAQSSTQSCVFCNIVEGKIPSYKVGENETSLAVLELNPISRGHAIIIPKTHVSKNSDLPQKTFDFVKFMISKMQTILGTKEVRPFSTNIMGHELINLLPIYDNESPESPRKKATKEELEELQKVFTEEKIKEPPKEEKPVVEQKKEDFSKWWLPQRRP